MKSYTNASAFGEYNRSNLGTVAQGLEYSTDNGRVGGSNPSRPTNLITMISYLDLAIIAIVHWIADFVLQTHWQATNKSKDTEALISHTITYSAVWFIVAPFIVPLHIAIFFVVITFIVHTVTDYFTSRWTSRLYAKGDYHNFFVVIGFDQLLHYTQLLLTYYLLK